MIFAETSRLYLRTLEKSDLPHVPALIGEWDVVKWLAVVPYPYTAKDADDYYDKMADAYRHGAPEYFVIAPKADNRLIGAVGLHASRAPQPQPGEIEIGYWLGKAYWGQGFMSEAVKPVIDLAFQRPEIALVASTTDPANAASQNVLRKAGLNYLGIFPRTAPALRGGPEVTRWELTRGDYEKSTGSR